MPHKKKLLYLRIFSKTFSYLFSDSREIRLPEKFNTRNFPPDGTTFQQIVLGQKLAVTIPPFGYLNVQFFHQVSMQMRRRKGKINNFINFITSMKSHKLNWYANASFSYAYHIIIFHFKDASYVTFDLYVPRGTSFGLYARRNALPTHTHYNFMEVITGFKQHTRSVRSSEVSNKHLLFQIVFSTTK